MSTKEKNTSLEQRFESPAKDVLRLLTTCLSTQKILFRTGQVRLQTQACFQLKDNNNNNILVKSSRAGFVQFSWASFSRKGIKQGCQVRFQGRFPGKAGSQEKLPGKLSRVGSHRKGARARVRGKVFKDDFDSQGGVAQTMSILSPTWGAAYFVQLTLHTKMLDPPSLTHSAKDRPGDDWP